MASRRPCPQCKRVRFIAPQDAPCCTPQCQRAYLASGAPRTVTVFCCVCGVAWHPGEPGVHYRSEDNRWWCADETSCWSSARRRENAETQAAAEIAAMYRALQAVWDDLELNGWRI